LTDLSLSGAFIEVAAPFRVLSLVEIIAMPRRSLSTDSFMLSGYVVRLGAGGFGIEWSEPVVAEVSRLRRALVPGVFRACAADFSYKSVGGSTPT
jgi:hypothetical protein